MRAAWERVRLGEVLHLQDSAISVSQLGEVSLAGIYSFGRGLFKRGPMSPAETSYKTYNRLCADDFVISQPKAWEGAIARVSKEFDGWFLSPVFPTFRADRQRLEPRYLEWFCKQSSVWTELQHKSRGMGARRESVSPEQFLSLEIPLPSLDEQRRVVARIEELAAKVEEAQQNRGEAQQLSDAFVTNHHLQLAGTRWRKLGDVIRLDEEIIPIEPAGEYPQIGIRSFGGGLFAKPALRGVDTAYKTFNRLYDGAVVLSQVKGWEGAIAVCSPELAGWYASPEYRTFRCNPGESRPGYIAALVRTGWFHGLLQQATRGVGARRERTRPEQFLEIELPMPPEQLQIEAELAFEQMERMSGLQSKSTAALDTLIPSILDRAFTGEL